MQWATRIEFAKREERVNQVVAFIKQWVAGLPAWIESTRNAVITGKARNISKWPEDRKRLFATLATIQSSDDFTAVSKALACIETLAEKPIFVSREIWCEMRKTLEKASALGSTKLAETAWAVRDLSRRIGRRVPRRCISTTLLVKGLEFDHVLVLDQNDFPDAENLYVALTRGARSVGVLSNVAILKRPLPRFKQNAAMN